MKRFLVLTLSIIMICLVTSCSAPKGDSDTSNNSSKTEVNINETEETKVDFDIKYERTEIQEFMDVVCKNAKVELAQVGLVGYYSENYTATLIVKPYGMVEEKIYVSFYNSDNLDKISSIVVEYSGSDDDNVINCKDAIVEALEVSFCGSSKAKDYTDEFDSVAMNLTLDEQIITNYSLTDEASVRISCLGAFANDWIGWYCIYKN